MAIGGFVCPLIGNVDLIFTLEELEELKRVIDEGMEMIK